MKSKILLIVEGEDTEPTILGNATHGLLSLIGADYEIVPFKNPIYELYEAYKEGEYDDIVAFLRANKNLKINDNILSKNAFSAIYLIFDFEPHYHKYSDDIIRDLLQTFDNETELGKLYINYPMVESYYHLQELPDDKYNDRTVTLEGFNGKNYKKLVNTTTCLKKNFITEENLCYIIYHNYMKSKTITACDEIRYDLILENQIKKKNEERKVFVLCTFPLLTVDYNQEYTLEKIQSNIHQTL